MPTAKSFLEGFSRLDDIIAERVASSIEEHKNLQFSGKDQKFVFFENELGNKLLYPQAVPLTGDELKFNLAILREALKLQPQKFYNPNLARIVIPKFLLESFPDVFQLTLSFIEAFNPFGIVSLYLESESSPLTPLGSFIKPETISGSGVVDLKIEGKGYKLKTGTLESIPAQGINVDFIFSSSVAKLKQKNQLSEEIIGGDLGVIVDIRILT